MFAAIPSESASYLENITEKVSFLFDFEHNFSLSFIISNYCLKVIILKIKCSGFAKSTYLMISYNVLQYKVVM